MQPALTRQRIDAPGVGGIDGERLLGQDVDPGLERGERLLRAKRHRSGQGHDVRARGDDLAPIGRGVREPEPLLERGELGGIAPVHDPWLDLGPAQETRDVGEGRPRSGTDDTQAQSTLAHDMIHPPLTSIVAPLM